MHPQCMSGLYLLCWPLIHQSASGHQPHVIKQRHCFWGRLQQSYQAALLAGLCNVANAHADLQRAATIQASRNFVVEAHVARPHLYGIKTVSVPYVGDGLLCFGVINMGI